MGMTTLLISLVAIVLIAGIALAVSGWRGRRVGDHPYCRKCGFDLFGVAERSRCPECGADVTMPKATRIGTRVRRRGMLVGGIAITVIAAATLVIVGTHVARSVPWIRYEPVWMLRL